MEKEEREILTRRRGRGNLLATSNNIRRSQRPLLPPSNNQNHRNDPADELMGDYERILQLEYQNLLDIQRRNREIQSWTSDIELSVDHQANQRRSREPSRNAFEYTFDAQREEDDNFLTVQKLFVFLRLQII